MFLSRLFDLDPPLLTHLGELDYLLELGLFLSQSDGDPVVDLDLLRRALHNPHGLEQHGQFLLDAPVGTPVPGLHGALLGTLRRQLHVASDGGHPGVDDVLPELVGELVVSRDHLERVDAILLRYDGGGVSPLPEDGEEGLFLCRQQRCEPLLPHSDRVGDCEGVEPFAEVLQRHDFSDGVTWRRSHKARVRDEVNELFF